MRTFPIQDAPKGEKGWGKGGGMGRNIYFAFEA